MTDLFLIPGAWSTATSFNYLISVFSNHPKIDKIHSLEYDAFKERVPTITAKTNDALDKIHNDVILVGHSLGGIVAANVVNNHSKIKGMMTISSPLAGVRYNILLNYYLCHRFPILDDIVEGSEIIEHLHQTKFTKNFTMMVSTVGFNPIIFEPNDGVVTVNSQVEWQPKNARVVSINTSHNEILQHYKTVTELGRMVQG